MDKGITWVCVKIKPPKKTQDLVLGVPFEIPTFDPEPHRFSLHTGRFGEMTSQASSGCSAGHRMQLSCRSHSSASDWSASSVPFEGYELPRVGHPPELCQLLSPRGAATQCDGLSPPCRVEPTLPADNGSTNAKGTGFFPNDSCKLGNAFGHKWPETPSTMSISDSGQDGWKPPRKGPHMNRRGHTRTSDNLRGLPLKCAGTRARCDKRSLRVCAQLASVLCPERCLSLDLSGPSRTSSRRSSGNTLLAGQRACCLLLTFAEDQNICMPCASAGMHVCMNVCMYV